MGFESAAAATAAAAARELGKALHPADGPSSPELTDGQKVFENTVLTVAAIVATVLLFLPAMAWVYFQLLQLVKRMFSPASAWAGLLNGAIWVGYTSAAVKKGDGIEVFVACLLTVVVNFVYLLILYGHERNYWMVLLLHMVVLPTLTYTFFTLRFQVTPPQNWPALGFLGLSVLVWCHGCLFNDIAGAESVSEFVFAFCNVIPNGILNAASAYVLLTFHSDEIFITLSACGSFVASLLEFTFILIRIASKTCCSGDDGVDPPVPPRHFPHLQDLANLLQFFVLQNNALGAPHHRGMLFLDAAGVAHHDIALQDVDNDPEAGLAHLAQEMLEHPEDAGDNSADPSGQTIPAEPIQVHHACQGGVFNQEIEETHTHGQQDEALCPVFMLMPKQPSNGWSLKQRKRKDKPSCSSKESAPVEVVKTSRAFLCIPTC